MRKAITSKQISGATGVGHADVVRHLVSMASKGWLRSGAIKGSRGTGRIDYEQEVALGIHEVILFGIQANLEEHRTLALAVLCEEHLTADARSEPERAARAGRDALTRKKVRWVLAESGIFAGGATPGVDRRDDGILVLGEAIRMAPAIMPIGELCRTAGIARQDVASVVAGLPSGVRVGPKKYNGKTARSVMVGASDLVSFISTPISE